MKTLATEIKVGNEIKYGNQWGKVVELPVQSRFVSSEVDIKVETIAGKIKRRDGYSDITEGGIKTTYSYRKTTMVPTR